MDPSRPNHGPQRCPLDEPFDGFGDVGHVVVRCLQIGCKWMVSRLLSLSAIEAILSNAENLILFWNPELFLLRGEHLKVQDQLPLFRSSEPFLY